MRAVKNRLDPDRPRFKKQRKGRPTAPFLESFQKDGGAEGDRTPDLRNAIATLSQLSYGPDP